MYVFRTWYRSQRPDTKVNKSCDMSKQLCNSSRRGRLLLPPYMNED